jgi:hypothetical protein
VTQPPILNEDPNGRPFGTRGPRRVRITVPVEGTTIDVIAYPTETPGLVVQRRLEPNGDEFFVTHVRTGLALPIDFHMMRVAFRFAEALAPVMDWTSATFTEEDFEAARQVIREFQETICTDCDGTGDLLPMDCERCCGSGLNPAPVEVAS